MNDLSYLIISKNIHNEYHNTASLINLYPNDADFTGYSEADLQNGFGYLIEQHFLIPYPGQSGTKNFALTKKGRDAFDKETERRKEKIANEQLQKNVSESVVKTNTSVIDTNHSVRQTNESVQELNRVSATNYKTQNRLTVSSIIVALASVLIAIISLVQSSKPTDNSKIIEELRENNRLLKEQNLLLKDTAQHKTIKK
jgi:hypothetical protein